MESCKRSNARSLPKFSRLRLSQIFRCNESGPLGQRKIAIHPRTTLLFAVLLLTVAKSQAQDTGRIRGALVIHSEGGDAVVPEYEIAFVSEGLRKSVVTNALGQYQADLPAGKYSVSFNHPGFYPIQRAPLEVKAGKTVMINLKVMAQPITHYNFGEFSYTEKPDDPLKTEHLRDGNVMIRFAERTVSVDSTEYRGRIFRSGNERLDVLPILTHNELAIYAERIIIGKDSAKVRAVGNVVVEDGKQSRVGSEAFVDLGAAEPVTTLRIDGP